MCDMRPMGLMLQLQLYEDPQLVQLSKGMSPMDPEFGIEPADQHGMSPEQRILMQYDN